MEEKITLCGDNCVECPRYNTHTDKELRAAAELWYKVGWRESIVSNEEIACSGCSSHKQCTYQLVVVVESVGEAESVFSSVGAGTGLGVAVVVAAGAGLS